MSWNPLKLFTAPKELGSSQAFTPAAEECEVEKCISQFNNFIETSKKLHKDAKKYTLCVYALSRCEHKITQDFSGSVLCHHNDELRSIIEDYHTVTSQMSTQVDDMIIVSQKAVVDPLKKLNTICNGVQLALKKRDQLIQECHRCQLKLEKLQEKERTGANVAKSVAGKQALTHAQEELANFNKLLLKEIPDVLALRIDYFQPCLEALIRAQVYHYGECAKLFNSLLKRPELIRAPTDSAFEMSLQQKMSEVKALSIVADD